MRRPPPDNCMKIKFYPEKKLKKEILEIIGKHLNLNEYKVFFFGSRVSGKGDERSDIDIGIEGPRPVPFEVMAKIKEEISNIPTLYSIDVIDFKGVEKDFYQVAKQNIEIVR